MLLWISVDSVRLLLAAAGHHLSMSEDWCRCRSEVLIRAPGTTCCCSPSSDQRYSCFRQSWVLLHSPCRQTTISSKSLSSLKCTLYHWKSEIFTSLLHIWCIWFMWINSWNSCIHFFSSCWFYHYLRSPTWSWFSVWIVLLCTSIISTTYLRPESRVHHHHSSSFHTTTHSHSLTAHSKQNKEFNMELSQNIFQSKTLHFFFPESSDKISLQLAASTCQPGVWLQTKLQL